MIKKNESDRNFKELTSVYKLNPYICIMKQMQIHNSTDIVADIKQIIEQARKQAYASIP